MNFFKGNSRAWILVLTGCLVIFTVAVSSLDGVQAAACTVDNLNLHNPPINSDDGFDFQITNSDITQWVRVTSPTGEVVLYDAASNDFNPDISSSHVVFSGGSVDGGNQFGLHVVAHVDAYSPPSNWTVEVSADPGGANPIGCGGDTSLNISDSNPPSINSISTAATSTTATVSWTTTKPTNSTVTYGEDSSYGQEKVSAAYSTLHHQALTGLQPETGYHFQIVAVDQAGNSTSSDDNTFFTSAAPAPNSPASNSTLLSTHTFTVTEHVPPTVALKTALDKPFKQPPLISGIAADNAGLFGVEYSTDGGKDWLPVDSFAPLSGGKVATFSFTPPPLEDGNYTLLARAVDTSGNIGLTDPETLIIDRLPPQVGAAILSSGPEVLSPSSDGLIDAMTGLDLKITAAAVGGPTAITLDAKQGTSGGVGQRFTLSYSAETGLWSGLVSFARAGHYSLVADSLDGAGNRTSRTVAQFAVSSPPTITGSGAKALPRASVAVYSYNESSRSWALWDGDSYGQTNPQRTDKVGAFRLLVPAGRYYLRASAHGRQPVESAIFTVTKPTPLTRSIRLPSALSVGPLDLSLPAIFAQHPDVLAKAAPSEASATQSLIGTRAPAFILPSSDGGSVSPVQLEGKPTVLTLLATWSPSSTEQLPALESLQRNADLNVIPVFSQQNLANVSVYTRTGGYHLTVLADPDGTLTVPYGLSSLPTHYFIDRSGIIRKIIAGVLSTDQLLGGMVGL